jgi:hypothetical protein
VEHKERLNKVWDSAENGVKRSYVVEGVDHIDCSDLPMLDPIMSILAASAKGKK